MDCRLTEVEANHLRRLLGWVACEVGQEPDEMVVTVQNIADKLGCEISEESKGMLVDGYLKSTNVPKYVRAAVKSLSKAIQPHVGDIVDGEAVEQKRLPTQYRCNT